METLADIGIDAVMVIAIIVTLSSLVYLITISLRERATTFRHR